MKALKATVCVFGVVFVTFLLADTCFASELGTFASFYKKSVVVGWVLAALVAVVSGIAVYFTGGLSSPLLVGPIKFVGSMIGGAMGLSGVAATNAGLAMLGGGAVTAGGLGMAGGAALLTTIFSFGTEVVSDYGINKIFAEYSYSRMQEEAAQMPNFPPIVNTSGPDCIEEAVDILEDGYMDEEVPGSDNNRKVLEKAYNALNVYDPSFTAEENARLYSARALLLFIMSDFKMAYYDADEAIKTGVDDPLTVPRYVAAVSGYLTGATERYLSTAYFRESIIKEPDNPFIPLMYSLYISRLGIADKIRCEVINNIAFIGFIEDDEMRKSAYYIIETAYFSRIKICQNIITTCHDNRDNEIIDRERLKEKAADAMEEYTNLLNSTEDFITENISRIDADDGDEQRASDNLHLIEQYRNDTSRLERLYREI